VKGFSDQISSLPSDFNVGNAEKERQPINQRFHNRKTKTAFTPSIPITHFSPPALRIRSTTMRDGDGLPPLANGRLMKITVSLPPTI
jgi:hypothetical protein